MPYKDRAVQSAYTTKRCKDAREKWLLENGPCVACGSRERLEVDHIDPSEKTSHRIWSWAISRRLLELSKCQVLCYLCHKKKTADYARLTRSREAAHGTESRYRYDGCRCDLCRGARKIARRSRYLRNGT